MIIKVCDKCGDCESKIIFRPYLIPDFSESVSPESGVYEYEGERVHIRKIDLCPQCAESLKESLEVWQQN